MHPSTFARAAATGLLTAVAALTFTTAAVADPPPDDPDPLINVGSKPAPFSHNKQNEPGIAYDPMRPNIIVAGANDALDQEACDSGPDYTCPFTPGVGTSGVYLSFDTGRTWVQPTYTGNTARACAGVPGPDAGCVPAVGSIGTLPHYYEAGLVSGGGSPGGSRPSLVFGPRPGTDGKFSWDNGSRLYYSNLAGVLPGQGAPSFRVAVSRTDDVQAAAAGNASAWKPPVIASGQSGATFLDKAQIWADNAATSHHFGNVYACYNGYPEAGAPSKHGIFVASSRDGGNTWEQEQVTSTVDDSTSRIGLKRAGCTVRTSSRGVVNVFYYEFGTGASGAAAGKIKMIKSFDGGRHWTPAFTVQTAYDICNYFEPSIGHCVLDGVGGARADLVTAPSVDIANGAPTGRDATDQIVMVWTDGRDGLGHEHVMFSSSAHGGWWWTQPRRVETQGDRGSFAATAISPDGMEAWIVYDALTTPFRTSASGPAGDRQFVGVSLHADATRRGVGPFTQIHRGVPGDPRASSQGNLAASFLGDHTTIVASRTYGAIIGTDIRNGADCPAVDEYRQAAHDAAAAGKPVAVTPPPVQSVCPPTFGNSDIYAGAFPNDFHP
jgi:hypothetical protein